MIIKKFGIELSSLRLIDLEMVRTWRNQDFVRSQMIYRSIIDKKSQIGWFNNLKESDVYLIIKHDEKPVGVINVKNINRERRIGEAGVFIGERSYLNSPIPILAILNLMDTFFFNFGFSELHATVLKDNKSALELNQHLGYTVSQEEESWFKLVVTANSYKQSRTKFEKLLQKLDSKRHEIELTESEKKFLLPKKKLF